MATLIANANTVLSGNFGLVDSTSMEVSGASSTALTTSLTYSSTFTPGAITIDAIAIQIGGKSASTSVTIDLGLYQNTTLVSGTAVSIHSDDVGVCPTNTSGGWVLFKFASPVTLAAATAYRIGLRSATITSGSIAIMRTTTAGNWNRMLRTTTSQAYGLSSDILYIMGEYTAANTYTPITITMDITTSAANWGTFYICNGGVLQWGVSASTNYYLKQTGDLILYNGATYKMGTVASPLPSSSTHSHEFVSASGGQYGIRIWGTDKLYIEMVGYEETYKQCKLNADAAAGATSLTADISTGWKSGDTIAIAATGTSATECELRTLGSDASGTSIPVPALTNAHSGTAGSKAEIVKLNRRSKIFGQSTTNTCVFASFNTSAQTMTGIYLDIRHIEFYYIGTTTFRVLQFTGVAGNTNPVRVENCTIHDTPNNIAMIYINNSHAGNLEYKNCFVYGAAAGSGSNVGAQSVNNANDITGTVIDGVIAMNCGASCFNMGDTGVQLKNCVAVGSPIGVVLADITNSPVAGWDTVLAHSCSTSAFTFNATFGDAMTALKNLTAYRCPIGLSFNASSADLVIDGANIYGCTAQGMSAGNANTMCDNIKIINSSFNGMTGTAQPYGVNFTVANNTMNDIIFDNCTFGNTIAHTTADIQTGTATSHIVAKLRNCLLSSTTEIGGTGVNMGNTSYVSSQDHDQSLGSHRIYSKSGVLFSDTTIYKTASPSLRMQPRAAGVKLDIFTKKCLVDIGDTVSISVWVRKSVVGDGTAYNGSQPRLIQRAGSSGNQVPVVLATASGAAGSWEQITATTAPATKKGVMVFTLDCDGSTGWINIDDFTVTSSNRVGSEFDYWLDALPDLAQGGGSGGSAVAMGNIHFS